MSEITSGVKSIGSDIADAAAGLTGFKNDVVLDNWTKRLTVLTIGAALGAAGTAYAVNKGMTKAKVSAPVRQAIRENTFCGSLLVAAA